MDNREDDVEFDDGSNSVTTSESGSLLEIVYCILCNCQLSHLHGSIVLKLKKKVWIRTSTRFLPS